MSSSESGNVWSVAHAGFLKGGGGAGNLKIKKTKSKISPLRISPVFGSKLGEDQQSSSLKFSSVFGPKLGEDQKIKNKRSSPRFCPFVYSNFLPKLQRVGPCRNFAYYSMLLILSWRPKGGGGMAPCSPQLNTLLCVGR